MNLYDRLIENADKYIGIHRGKKIDDIFISNWLNQTGLPLKNSDGDYTPYCAAFVIHCLNETATHNVYKSAKSLSIWNKTPIEMRTTKPFKGCLFVWNFGANKGHIGFVKEVLSDNKMTTIEGNTTNPNIAKIGSERNGGWVLEKKRSSKIGKIDNIELLGFIDPFKKLI